MNSPKTIAAVKAVFHALTVASTALAAYGSLLPGKSALYVAATSAFISGILHVLTAIYPDIAKAESGQ